MSSHMKTTSCTCGIDVHAHVVPENFPRYVGKNIPADWPSMAPAHECHRHVMISGKVYRTVSDRCWDVYKRVEDMAHMELSLQAISPMPELLSYWMEAKDATVLLRYLNEQMADMVARADGRLCALGAVPLQDVELAIKELDYLMDALGFAGVEIGSNVNGKPIGDPQFEPFFAAAAAKGAAVFVHALRPTGMDRLVGPGQLQQVLAYPSDVGLAAASVITSNLIERHPTLRIAFSHGGGTLAMLLPRLEQASKVFPVVRECVHGSPTAQARRLFYDALVFDGATLRHLVHTFGEDRILIGTDYPFNFHDDRPAARIREALHEAGEDVIEKLLLKNASRFLGHI